MLDPTHICNLVFQISERGAAQGAERIKRCGTGVGVLCPTLYGVTSAQVNMACLRETSLERYNHALSGKIEEVDIMNVLKFSRVVSTLEGCIKWLQSHRLLKSEMTCQSRKCAGKNISMKLKQHKSHHPIAYFPGYRSINLMHLSVELA